MTIQFAPAAVADLEEVPAADAARLVASINKLAALADAGQNAGHFARLAASVGANVKAIVGADGFRVRQGNWRALITVEDDTVTVRRVAHRREVYD